jgi:hypothetical protein
MPRLEIQRQKQLEPERLAYAKSEIEKLGYEVKILGTTTLQFEFKGYTITFHAYSGWASGSTITDGRGIKNLLNQIKQ